MSIKKEYFILTILLLIQSINSYATHNRAGEITYKQIDALTIEVTITTYTKTSSVAVDRDSLEVFWGDGSSQFLYRIGNGQPLGNDVKKNEYVGQHTYPGRGTYTIAFLDPNRVDNILNVNYPNSIEVPFYLSTTFTLLNAQFQGFNNSAVLLQPPIDVACVGETYRHNPNAFDIDGDSLAYELVAPLMDVNTSVPDYKFPDELLPSANNKVTLDPVTGDFVWKTPPQEGEYNIAILVKEYRKGVLITSIIRDMQIRIVKCSNDPPTISGISEICVIAGDTVNLDFKIDDPNAGQKVRTSITGGPLVLDPPAQFIPTGIALDPPYDAQFVWATNCDHVSPQPYQIVIRAVDNYFADTSGLATFHTVRITVIAPPPEDLQVISSNDALELDWLFPYVCDEPNSPNFQGFSIWRRISSNPSGIDSCTTGLENYDYDEIVFLTNQNDGDRYFHIDEDVIHGVTYCYRIQGEFALETPTGSIYNRTESLPSNEFCIVVSRDLPYITKTSIIDTDSNIGSCRIRWSKPLPQDLDTLANPGPYKTEIHRKSSTENSFQLLPASSRTFNTISAFQDTIFLDIGLNTMSESHEYKIVFYTNNNFSSAYGESSTASTVYLEVAPSDQTNNLSWEADVPWSNYEYIIYRRNDANQWDSIDISNTTEYIDNNLTNGKEYCYRIESIGTYGISGIENPIRNYSQERCALPIDNVPPCTPDIELSNNCNDIDQLTNIEDIFNTLRWSLASDCSNTDAEYFNIYFKPHIDSTFRIIATKDNKGALILDHQPSKISVRGCYAVAAVDSLGNESALSSTECIDNCPFYILPNTFTPNGDGNNDLFTPRQNFFISRVDFKVFNEWGNLVFETMDPELNWDGKSNSSKVSAGTYYYVCDVFIQEGNNEIRHGEPLQGFINIVYD